jgi:hypothetical protein
VLDDFGSDRPDCRANRWAESVKRENLTDLEILDASQKRAVTICNLFSNEKQSITQIANVLDMSDRPLKPTVPVSAVYCRDEKGNSTTNSWREANQ